MDLRDLDTLAAAEKGLTFDVVHPFNGEPLTSTVNKKEVAWKITVVGVGSRLYKQAQKKLENAQKASWANKHKAISEEEEEELSLNIAATCTTGWEGIHEDGKPVEFNKANATRLFKEYPWLAKQVTDAMFNIEAMLEKN